MRVVVLVSGQGSNLRAILDAVDGGRCAIDVVGVVSHKRAAPALELARERGIETRVVSPRDFADRPAWDQALADAVAELDPELVVMAGFMRVVGAPLLSRFERRIINVHPSLLPAFPGKDGPQQAIDAGVRLSGCTVHVVDPGVDSGTILAQAAVPVLIEDDARTLHERIQKVEHRLLPAVIHWIATDHVHLEGEERWVRLPSADHLSALVYPPLPESAAQADEHAD